MKKIIISSLIIILMIISMLPTGALAADGSISANGTYDMSEFGNDSEISIIPDRNVTITNSLDITYTNVRIVVSQGTSLTIDNVKIDNTGVDGTDNNHASGTYPIYLNDNTELLLSGNSIITGGSNAAGIKCWSGSHVSISGTGSLYIEGGSGGDGIDGVDLTILGGTIDAKGGIGGSGISGSSYLTISGGTITAIGQGGEPGINGGGGYAGIECTIKGGTVTAYGGSDGGAGIGSRSGRKYYDINIQGGTVYAYGGSGAAGIGGGNQDTMADDDSGQGVVTISGGSVFAKGSEYAAGIGGGNSAVDGGTTNLEGGILRVQGGDDSHRDIGKSFTDDSDYTINVSNNHVGVFYANSVIITDPVATYGIAYSYSESYVDGKVYGVHMPEDWTQPYHYYINTNHLYDLAYDINGGSGTVPGTSTQLKGTTTIIEEGTSLTNGVEFFDKWNTQADGMGTDYLPDDEFAFPETTTLYAMYKAPFAQGDGTEGNPYGISTPEQLNAVRNYPDAHFIMLNDIDMSAATRDGGVYWNDGTGWEPIGDNITPFEGVFDGGGFAIKYLNIKNPDTSYIGLFGKSNGSIMRLGMQDCEIVADDDQYEQIYVGGIAGWSNGPISECYNTGNILASCYHAEVGGIAGIYGTIEKCFNVGTISANGYYANVGGIIGSYGHIDECYNMGSVTLSGDNVGAIAGSASILTNCYYVNGNMQGAVSGVGSQTNVVRKTTEEMTQQSEFIGFDFIDTWVMSIDESYPCPVLQSVVLSTLSENTINFSGGVGTLYNPYKISTQEQLNNIRYYLGAHFVLMNSLDMSAATSEGGAYYNSGLGWIPLGGDQENAFCGSFDGGGFVINGIQCTNTSSDGALFFRNDGIITNLGIEDIYIDTLGRTAAVAVKSYGIIENCYSTGEINGHECAGIAAVAAGTISNCYNTAKITSLSNSGTSGGIVGHLDDYGQVSSCYNTGDISGSGPAGGIIGEALYSDGTRVENCFNIGSVFVQDDTERAGGIVGDGIDEIHHCYNIGIIDGSDYNAAIVSRLTSNTVLDTYYLDTGEEDLKGAYNYGNDTELSNIKTHEEMAEQSTYIAFDFDNIWEMPDTGYYQYPVFQGMSIEPLQGDTKMFAGGIGTMASPYIISTPEHLNNIRNYDYKYFILANDIDMTASSSEGGAYWNDGAGWEPIGFSSTLHILLDGNGYTISGLNINRPDTMYVGLFGRISSSFIKNLNLVNVEIIGAYNCGGIAGYCEGDVINCSVDGSVLGTIAQSNYGIGGIVGQMYGDISYCTNSAAISSHAQTGGIVGKIDGDIFSCSNHGVITGLGSLSIGGIAGVTYGKIEDCYNTGDLYQTDAEEDSGGIAGWHYSSGYTYVNCYSIGQSTYGITACYWLNTTLWSNCYYLEGVVEKAGNYGDPVSTADLENGATYVGFDFTDTWTMDGEDTYPYAELQNTIQPPITVEGTFDLSDFGSDSVIYVGTVETGPEVVLTNNSGETFYNVEIVCLEGVTLTLYDVDIYNGSSSYDCALSFSGSDNHLILEGRSSLYSGSNVPGIQVVSGTSLEISGDGELEASGNAGIGARDGILSAGDITITGGIITATGRWNGAGIGGGEYGRGGNITILGGVVIASGGPIGGAGIGGGYAGSGGEIIIEGGHITARGGADAAGIGGGYARGGEIITISGGTVNAVGSLDAAGIGGGAGGAAGEISISGGMVYAQQGNDFARHDIGYGSGSLEDVLSISGNVIVFLREGDCMTPETTTHELFTTNVVTDHKAFGLDIPYSWESPIYAYLNSSNVFGLEYNVNGGTGNVPSTITQYINTTVEISTGDNLSMDGLSFVEWNTSEDGAGDSYNPGGIFLFDGEKILYAIYEDPIPVESVSLSSNNENLIVGDLVKLGAVLSPENATYQNVTWKSSNKQAASVDAYGNVSAVGQGSATITVTTQDGALTDTCLVTVTQPVTGVDIDEESLVMTVGGDSALSVVVNPTGATNKNVSWSSSNIGVATVDKDGNVLAMSKGTAIITVTTEDGSYDDTCTVTVKSAEIESSVYTFGSGGIFSGIKIDTTVAQLIANLDNDSADIKIFDQNGDEVSAGFLCTGMTVKLVIDGTVRDELTIVILGDANGDGGISITDYTLTRLDILGLKSLGQTAASAADINGDGVVSITDYTLIRLDILELKKIH